MFVQRAWRTSNSVRITVPVLSAAGYNLRLDSPRLGDVELEYVRAAKSHKHTSRAAGVDLVVPSGSAPFTAQKFAYEPFYATYTKVRPRMLLLTFAQLHVETGPHANAQIPVSFQCTVVSLLSPNYYVGTRLSVISAVTSHEMSTIERFQVGRTSDRGHLALFADVPMDGTTRKTSFHAAYGLTYNIISM